jgi:hypothetical protein
MSSPSLVALAGRRLNAEQLRNLIAHAPIVARRVLPVHPYTAVARHAALVGALRRPVRRRKAIIKHFEHRVRSTATENFSKGRLKKELFNARIAAYKRGKLNKEGRARAKRSEFKKKAGAAHWAYMQAGSNNAWNRFISLHIKAGGNAHITRVAARSMYN